MKFLVPALIIIALFAACSRDHPSLTEEQVIANVQDALKNRGFGAVTDSTCYDLIAQQVPGGWSSATALYIGSSQWEVEAGTFRWIYTEEPSSLVIHHPSPSGAIPVC